LPGLPPLLLELQLPLELDLPGLELDHLRIHRRSPYLLVQNL